MAAPDFLPGGSWLAVLTSLRLSRREAEIVEGILGDENEHSIAARLGISSHTVHTHLERLYRKLRVSSRCQVVVRMFAEYVSIEAKGPRASGPLTAARTMDAIGDSRAADPFPRGAPVSSSAPDASRALSADSSRRISRQAGAAAPPAIPAGSRRRRKGGSLSAGRPTPR
jgi:DNA-binding CsgD family transcriptional regulator